MSRVIIVEGKMTIYNAPLIKNWREEPQLCFLLIHLNKQIFQTAKPHMTQKVKSKN